MPVTQYIGSRYVPIFADPIAWSDQKEYEPLTIVIHEGNSYTSKQFVPVGIDIANEAFWALTGNYNAQVEQYRRETAAAREAANNAQIAADSAQSDIDTLLPSDEFDSTNTVKKYVDDSIEETADNLEAQLDATATSINDRIDAAITEIQPPVFSSEDAEKFFANYSTNLNPNRNRGIHSAIDSTLLYVGNSPATFAAGHQDVAVFMTVVDSWLKNADKLTYSHGNLGSISYWGDYNNPSGVDPRNFTDDVSGRYWIDCETFAQMIGSCTPYSMSPYVRGANNSNDLRGINPIYNQVSNEIKPYWNYGSYPDESTFMDSPEHSRRLLSWQFAKALDDANRMNWVVPMNTGSTNTPRYYQIPQGAIIISGRLDDRYKGVGHCSLLLGRYGDKTYMVESLGIEDHGRTINVEDITTRAITPKGYYMPPYYPTLLPAPYSSNAMTDFYQINYEEKNLATAPIINPDMRNTNAGCIFFGIAPFDRSERMTNVHVKLEPKSNYNGFFMPENTAIEFDVDSSGAYGCFYPASFDISITLNDTSVANPTYNINLMRVSSDKFARIPTRKGC